MSTLQKTRKAKIQELIDKYQKLIDNIFKEVVKPLPNFGDLTNPEGEIIKSSEQLKYEFINLRKQALRNADEMLHSINDLESELLDPEGYKKEKEEAKKSEETTGSATNLAKKYSKKE